ncbi:GNAT family N-acetyltransferase [Streptacidiphilus griseoplanus]|uniref:GNAT family N-acetyltransferase n=1 Tax=Peterkaempfera griseoplana TaxID=66896 RepID=UPI0006E25FEE|nr:GNAT family N-acetyltransferase [Peterkaempfera griseoplana]
MDPKSLGFRADAAAHAFGSAMQRLVSVVPGAIGHSGPEGTLLALTRSQIPALNVVMSTAREPDAGKIADLAAVAAAEAARDGFPWSIRLRGVPDEAITRRAGEYGLTGTSEQPFMVMPLKDASRRAPAGGQVRVRTLSGHEYNEFAEVLAAGFGAPPVIISSLYTPAVLDTPGITAYLAEADGVAVAAGLGVVVEDHLGVINIATTPQHRGQGHARVMVERILADGWAAGAHTAYLHTTDEAVGLFEGLGFRTAETWTSLIAA